MKNEISEKGHLNTLRTSIGSGLAKKRDTMLGDFGGAKERLGMRVSADQNMKNWVNWITRQRYGGRPVEGNADDLRRFIKQTYGDYALQELEPTIQRVAGQPTPAGSQQIPAPAGSAPPAVANAAPAADPPDPAASNGAAPSAAAPDPAASAGATAGATAPDPAASAGPAPAGAAPGPKRARAPRAPKAPSNPEVPDWLARQQNQNFNASPDTYPPMDIPQTPRQRPNPPPARAQPRESIRIGGKLIEVALQRSQLDKVFQHLAAVQADHRDSQQPSQTNIPAPGQTQQSQPNQTQPAQGQSQPQGQPQPQGQGQAQAQPQGQAANGQQPQQQSAPRINVSQILSAQISADGLKRSNANLSPVERSYVNNALANGSMTFEELLDQLPEVKGATFVGLLKALAQSN